MFVSGGTAGNLSALIAARWRWRQRAGGAHDRTRGLLLASSGAHSSVVQAARAMDADVAAVPADAGGRLSRDRAAARPSTPSSATTASDCSPSSPRAARPTPASSTTCAPPPTLPPSWARGSTSTAPTAAPPSPPRACARASTASRPPTASSSTRTSGCSPRSTRAPCCTATRRSAGAPTPSTPSTSRSSTAPSDEYEWNASDYAHHLSRRARGLPLWFSLATHGTQAYTDAIETTLRVTREGAELVRVVAAPRADPRARAVRRAVPPRRLGRTPTTRRGATEQLATAAVVRHPDGVGRRDRAAVVHRQPADDRRRPRRDRRQPRRRSASWLISSSAAPAAWRRWMPNGASSPAAGSPITDGLVSAVGTGTAPRGDDGRSTPPAASSRPASSTPTTTCSRT